MYALQEALIKFAEERDWEQFQSPKNLSMALAVEASELMEHFQWLTEDESRNLPADKLLEVGEEVADVLLYTLLIAKRLDLDIYTITQDKLEKNAEKYPADKVRGSAKKSSEYN